MFLHGYSLVCEISTVGILALKTNNSYTKMRSRISSAKCCKIFCVYLPTVNLFFDFKSEEAESDSIIALSDDQPITVLLVLIVLVTIFRVRKQLTDRSGGNQFTPTNCKQISVSFLYIFHK